MNPNDRYKETQIRSAHPAELVLLLYDGAINFLSQAKYHMQMGNIEARVVLINRSVDIISELLGWLNIKGGEYDFKLSQLYTYMIRRLLTANATQSQEGIDEVLRLLTTIRDAWRNVVQEQSKSAEQPARPAGTPVLPTALSA